MSNNWTHKRLKLFKIDKHRFAKPKTAPKNEQFLGFELIQPAEF